MLIRPATPADIPAIRSLEASAAAAAHWGEQEYQRLFDAGSRRLVLVAEADDVRGFLIASQVGQEWELENIVVGQSLQRRGLATALLGQFLDIACRAGAITVFLEVRASNLPARSLYEKHGFRVIGRRPAYYDQPAEDAVLYRKVLSSPPS